MNEKLPFACKGGYNSNMQKNEMLLKQRKPRIISALIIFLCHAMVYYLADMIVTKFHLPLHDVSLPLDARIPLIPLFVLPYVACFLHWIYTFYLAAQARAALVRLSASIFIGVFVCLLFYLFLPTGIVRSQANTPGLLGPLVDTVHSLDSGVNLFPSMHCFIAWSCYVGMRKQAFIPRAYKLFTLFFSLIVCASTVLIKQHYIADVLPGMLLAEAAYFAAGNARVSHIVEQFWDTVYRVLKLDVTVHVNTI